MGSRVGPEVSRKENNKESGHRTLCWELRLSSCKKEKGWAGGGAWISIEYSKLNNLPCNIDYLAS